VIAPGNNEDDNPLQNEMVVPVDAIVHEEDGLTVDGYIQTHSYITY
jgi:hypothetical protein